MSDWTREQVDALEEDTDNHISDCEDCQRNLDSWDENGEEPPQFCPIGESLNETHMEAMEEYSEQPDYVPKTVTPVSQPCCETMKSDWENYKFVKQECGEMGWVYQLGGEILFSHIAYCQWCGSDLYE